MHLPLLTLHKGLKPIVPATIVCELACDLSLHQVENHLRWFNLSFSFAWHSKVVIHYNLNFSPSHPTWAVVTDLLINAATPPNVSPLGRLNTYVMFSFFGLTMQICWTAFFLLYPFPSYGHGLLNDSILLVQYYLVDACLVQYGSAVAMVISLLTCTIQSCHACCTIHISEPLI